MTASEIRAARERLGLTQGQAARLLGVDGRTWRYWEAGQRGVPEPVARLLRLAETPAVLRGLERLAAKQHEPEIG